jgi:hypothetical protein
MGDHCVPKRAPAWELLSIGPHTIANSHSFGNDALGLRPTPGRLPGYCITGDGSPVSHHPGLPPYDDRVRLADLRHLALTGVLPYLAGVSVAPSPSARTFFDQCLLVGVWGFGRPWEAWGDVCRDTVSQLYSLLGEVLFPLGASSEMAPQEAWARVLGFLGPSAPLSDAGLWQARGACPWCLVRPAFEQALRGLVSIWALSPLATPDGHSDRFRIGQSRLERLWSLIGSGDCLTVPLSQESHLWMEWHQPGFGDSWFLGYRRGALLFTRFPGVSQAWEPSDVDPSRGEGRPWRWEPNLRPMAPGELDALRGESGLVWLTFRADRCAPCADFLSTPRGKCPDGPFPPPFKLITILPSFK